MRNFILFISILLIPSVTFGVTFVTGAGSLRTGLIDYYRLENLIDFVGSNDLTNNNSVTFSAGLVNNAADGGTSNSNRVLSGGNLGLTGNVTFSQWVNFTTLPSDTRRPFAHGNKTNDITYFINYDGTDITWVRDRSGVATASVTETVTLATSTWYHFVLTYNGSNLEGWRDNVSKGTTAQTGNGNDPGPTEAYTLIGFLDINVPISGLVDEAGVWNRKISDSEVADLYHGGRGNRAITHRLRGGGISR